MTFLRAAVLLLLGALALAACGDPNTPHAPAHAPPVQAGAGVAEAGEPAPDEPMPEDPAAGVVEADPGEGDAPVEAGNPAHAAAHHEGQVERWYERWMHGGKAGHLHVVWTPGTRDGQPTVRDRTTIVSVSTRSMAGIRDRFESTILVDLERSEDGHLWSQSVRVEEAGRATVEETTWIGTGYRNETRLGNEREVVEIPLDEPVIVDTESFLGGPLRRGELEPGKRCTYASLDVRARRAQTIEVEVLGREDVTLEGVGTISCWKIAERHPESRAETLMWLGEDGGFVRLRGEDGSEIRKSTQVAAEAMPARPAEYGITVAARPRMERVFGADKLLVTLELQPDPDRKLPELPASPWSTAHEPRGSAKKGWEIDVDLGRHAGTGLSAPYPVELGDQAEALARDLEATVLMPVANDRLVDLAKEVVGDAKDARTAAYRLARWVFHELDKQSPEVAQASALEILDQRCGDCSEHALLFVALCRAAGIPARRCSGYVCVGSLWGAHAWSEIWVGEWIAADPTTGEIVPGARYLFFGYPDREGSFPGLVSSRIQGRLAIRTRRVEEGKAAYDVDDPAVHRLQDLERRRWLHVLCGLEAHDVPDDWSVSLSGAQRMKVSGPRLQADVVAFATQGNELADLDRDGQGSISTTFCGVPALLRGFGATQVYQATSRGRIVQIVVRAVGKRGDAAPPSAPDPEDLAQLELCLAPTFADPAQPFDAPN